MSSGCRHVLMISPTCSRSTLLRTAVVRALDVGKTARLRCAEPGIQWPIAQQKVRLRAGMFLSWAATSAEVTA